MWVAKAVEYPVSALVLLAAHANKRTLPHMASLLPKTHMFQPFFSMCHFRSIYQC